MDAGFCLFPTPLGDCGIVWTPGGVAGVQLPAGSAPKTRARLLSRLPGASEGAPPPEVRRAIRKITALLSGKPRSLDGVDLDDTGVPPFHREVYAVARTIPAGQTLSYGEIARRLGKPGAARAVGQALGRNPFAIVVPCHRVLAAGGKVGGFTAEGGTETKLRLLDIEGARPAVNTQPARGPSVDAGLAIKDLAAQDRVLGRLISRVGPYRLEQKATRNLFVALAEAIVHQQLNGKAAATIFARFVALFPRGRSGPTAEALLRLPDDALRSAGLSRSKALAIRDLALKTVADDLPTLAAARRLPDEALVEQLTKVRGIGRWTVEMLLMFRLGRPDVLPVDDYGIRKGYALAFGKSDLPAPKELARAGERWAPYRTVASWYLWRAVDLLASRSPGDREETAVEGSPNP